MQCADKPIYVRHADLNASRSKYTALQLSELIEYYAHGSVYATQPVGGVWKIWLYSNATRDYLLKEVPVIKFNHRRVELHDNNPFTSPHIPSEKIVIRDLPITVTNKEIMDYFETVHPHIITRSDAILERIPYRNNNQLSPFHYMSFDASVCFKFHS